MRVTHGNTTSMQDEMAHPTLLPLAETPPFMSRGEIALSCIVVAVFAFLAGGLL